MPSLRSDDALAGGHRILFPIYFKDIMSHVADAEAHTGECVVPAESVGKGLANDVPQNARPAAAACGSTASGALIGIAKVASPSSPTRASERGRLLHQDDDACWMRPTGSLIRAAMLHPELGSCPSFWSAADAGATPSLRFPVICTRNTDACTLIGDGTRNGLAYPPDGIHGRSLPRR